MKDTFIWEGFVKADVSASERCEDFCLDNVCDIANYIGSTETCIISVNGKKVRRINANPDLSIKGGTCDVSIARKKSHE